MDAFAGRALFYVLVESEGNPTDPLVLWLNGGPGCSSLGGGFMSELGPFLPRKDGKTLQVGGHTWIAGLAAVLSPSMQPAFLVLLFDPAVSPSQSCTCRPTDRITLIHTFPPACAGQPTPMEPCCVDHLP